MTDRTLFPDVPENHPDKPLPHNGTSTSKLAADTMKPFVGKQRERVLEFINAQIQDALTMNESSERPRRVRLVELGHVADSHNMRMTRSGCPAKVWVAVSPDQLPVADSKANWPTGGKSNPNKSDSAEFVPDFAI